MRLDLNKEVATEINKRNYFYERNFSKFACRSIEGRRLFPDRETIPDKENVRPIFFHDIDRIIHSRAYTRYIDKTQVFYLIENDHITHRVLHVQMVAKIARTIGKFLNINNDLIEAISLGHDVGHTPFGHNGETIISNFCNKHGIGCFLHNVQSFRLFHEIEKSGTGINISMQVLDGIICHNGEVLEREYKNDVEKTKKQLLYEYEQGMENLDISKKMVPMTLEGCVMRVSDIIAYVGKDIEDAIKLKLITKDDLPKDVVNVLGNNNADIINNLVIDITNNSFDKGSIIFSQEVFEALNELKKWNYQHIYSHPKKMIQDEKINRMFNFVLDKSLHELESETQNSNVVTWANNVMNKEYKEKTPIQRIVVDYVSGMTDDFILNTYHEYTIPSSFGYNFE